MKLFLEYENLRDLTAKDMNAKIMESNSSYTSENPIYQSRDAINVVTRIIK